MKRKNLIKFTLDLLMGITFALLFNKRVLGGLTFHEFAGLALGLAVVFHLLLNKKWIQGVSKALFTKTLATKARFGYVLNVLLFIDLLAILLSGLAISKVVLPGGFLQLPFLNQGLHIGASYLALVLLGLHIGLHWVWVMNVIKRLFHIKADSKVFSVVGKALALVVLCLGIWQVNETQMIQKVGMTFSAESHMRGGHGGFEGERGSRPSGLEQGRPSGGEFRGDRTKGGGPGGADPIEVVGTYGSIMAAFGVGTYYLEKLMKSKRKAK